MFLKLLNLIKFQVEKLIKKGFFENTKNGLNFTILVGYGRLTNLSLIFGLR